DAHSFSDSVGAIKYYDELTNRFSNSEWALTAKQVYGRQKSSLVSKVVPSFHVVAVEDSSIKYNDMLFRQKFLLIDFWATWCGPCIQEIPGLTKVYEKYHKNNFEVLSISLDTAAQTVQNFRK